jgi:hypothetical protein
MVVRHTRKASGKASGKAFQVDLSRLKEYALFLIFKDPLLSLGISNFFTHNFHAPAYQANTKQQ